MSSPDARAEPFDAEALPQPQPSHNYEATFHTESPQFDLVDMVNTIESQPAIVPPHYGNHTQPEHFNSNGNMDEGVPYYHYSPVHQSRQQGDFGASAYPDTQQYFMTDWDLQQIRGREFHNPSGQDRMLQDMSTEYPDPNAHYRTPTSLETGGYSPLNRRSQ